MVPRKACGLPDASVLAAVYAYVHSTFIAVHKTNKHMQG